MPGTLGASVLCLGPVGIDIVMEGYAPTDPERLSTWAGPVEMRMLAAGSVGYVALALSGLDRPVTLVSTVGDDHLGHEILTQLNDAGVATENVERASGPTSVAAYLRMFGDAKRPMVFRAAGYAPWPTASTVTELLRRLEPAALIVSGALHFPDYCATEMGPVMGAARALGIPTMLDPQFPPEKRDLPWAHDLERVLRSTDVLCCDEIEGDHLFGSSDVDEIIRCARSRGIDTVIVKREHLGSVIDVADVRLYQPAVPLGGGVGSTIGSGDAFLAGYVDAFLRGESQHDAVGWATAVAAAAISNPDGVRGVTASDAARLRMSVPNAHNLPTALPPARLNAPLESEKN